MSLTRHRVCFSTNLPRRGWVVCATTGSMHADRVKALLLFGGALSSAYKRTVIHTRQTMQDIVYYTSTVESQSQT